MPAVRLLDSIRSFLLSTIAFYLSRSGHLHKKWCRRSGLSSNGKLLANPASLPLRSRSNQPTKIRPQTQKANHQDIYGERDRVQSRPGLAQIVTGIPLSEGKDSDSFGAGFATSFIHHHQPTGGLKQISILSAPAWMPLIKWLDSSPPEGIFLANRIALINTNCIVLMSQANKSHPQRVIKPAMAQYSASPLWGVMNAK